MGVTVQVRNLDAGVQERLSAAARRDGLSLSGYLRRELTRLADAIDVRERLALSPRPLAGIPIQDVVTLLREDRDQ